MTAIESPFTVTGWHFAADKLRDGRPLPKAGDTLTHSGKVIACESGLHGSVRALDALVYAPGPFVARCELRGKLVPHNGDKYAASERHYLTGYVDATNTLHRFACWVATKALDREEASGRKVDPRSRAAIVAIDEATLDAAWGAARDAAWDAAWAAAWAAARAAARDAAWGEYNAELERMLTELLSEGGRP